MTRSLLLLLISSAALAQLLPSKDCYCWPPGAKFDDDPLLLREVPVRLTLPADLPHGPVRWSMANANGVAAAGVFVVGESNEVTEDEGRKGSQLLPSLPVTVNGRLYRIEEIDCYQFTAASSGLVTRSVEGALLKLSPGPDEVTTTSGKPVAVTLKLARSPKLSGPVKVELIPPLQLKNFVSATRLDWPADRLTVTLTFHTTQADAKLVGVWKFVARATGTRFSYPVVSECGAEVEFTRQPVKPAVDGSRVHPLVFGTDDPRSKELPKMMATDARRRLQEASEHESKRFAAIQTKTDWEKYRKVVYARGGIDPKDPLTGSPYLYLPHDAIVPGPTPVGSLVPILAKSKAVKYEATVDAQNRATGDKPLSPTDAAKWVAKQLRGE